MSDNQERKIIVSGVALSQAMDNPVVRRWLCVVPELKALFATGQVKGIVMTIPPQIHMVNTPPDVIKKKLERIGVTVVVDEQE